MIYGVAIGAGLVVLLLVLALRDRVPGRDHLVVANIDGGAPASNASMYGSDLSSSYPGTSTADDWDVGGKVDEICASGDNPSDAEQCDAGDSGSDGGGSDSGDGGDGGGGGGD